MTGAMAALAILPAAGVWALIALLRQTRLASSLADHPNERSLHHAPTPRVGGVAVVLVALPVAAALSEGRLAILGAAAVLAVLSLVDDWHSLPVEVRLPGHIVAALVTVLAIGGAAPGTEALGPVGLVIAVLGIAWSANLFNFMDGSDGLAGSMACVGFASLAAAAMWAGDGPLAVICTIAASACAGFLLHNWPPARVFLGDAGSIPLGFLAGALGLDGWLRGYWTAWFPLLVFSPFVVDATLTLLRRIGRGEPFWRAHRTHYYQRLVLSGWTQRRLAASALALMIAVASSALVALRGEAMLRCGILLFWTVAFAVLAGLLERRLGPIQGPPAR